MSKQIKVDSIVRKLYVSVNGQEVEVKQIDNPESYDKSVVVYVKELVKGASKGQKTYCVSVNDFVPKKRVSTKESVQSMLSSGLTADEIVARLTGTL